MAKRIIGLILSACLLAMSSLVLKGCAPAIVPVIEAKYPGCRVLKCEDLGKGYVEARLQCGPVIRVVKMREMK